MAGLCQYERVQLHTEPFFCATVARLFSTRRGKTRTCCFPRHRNVSYSPAHCAIVQLSSLVTQVVIKCHLQVVIKCTRSQHDMIWRQNWAPVQFSAMMGVLSQVFLKLQTVSCHQLFAQNQAKDRQISCVLSPPDGRSPWCNNSGQRNWLPACDAATEDVSSICL